MGELPELTKIFRSAWALNDKDPSSVMLEEREQDFRKVRALFLNTIFYHDWGRAYFAAAEAQKIAGAALVKTGTFGISESTQFSPTPEFLLDDETGIITVWVNAAVARAGEAHWDRVLREAAEEKKVLEEARKTDDPHILRYIAEKDVLRRRGRFPTFRTANLAMSEGQNAVNDLLKRLGIR